MATKRFEEVKNDTWQFAVRWKDPAGAVVDLTGYTVTVTVRSSYDTTGTPLLTQDASIVDNTASFSLQLAIPAADYVYDVQAKNGSFRKTLLRGVLSVLGEVTSA